MHTAKNTNTLSAISLRVIYCLMILSVLLSAVGVNPVSAAPAGTALQFDGSATNKQNVTFGAAPGLGVTTFTLEAWVKRSTGGIVMSTGSLGFDNTGGRPSIYPVVTKGMGEGETPANVNMNYFLGITSTGFVGADFEDKAGGVNHPAWGTTNIPVGEWHHIAATYSGTCWALYVDGNLETLNAGVTACPNATPESISIQHAGLAAAMNSIGALGTGFFSGAIDEARVWNRALSLSEIQANRLNELTSGSGLIARWGLNEGTGTTIASSVGSFPGTVRSSTSTLPIWVAGFPMPDSTPPAAPTGLTATPGSGVVSLSWTAPADPDVAGYNVYRSTTPSVPLTSPVNGGTLVSGTVYSNGGLTNGTPYYYVVTAVDTSTNQSGASNEVSATPLSTLGTGINFDGTNDYVTFGAASGLGLQNFTVETWFKRTGTGVAVSTGSNGVTAVPLVTKGSPQADGSNVDENYVLGIRSSDNVLAGDFETFAVCGSRPAGDNNPIVGVTPIVNNTWYHAAFTYDGTALKLYLNGNLESTLPNTCIPRYDSIQHAGLGTYITSTPSTSGYFQGVLDEARIWNFARSQAEIMGTINSEVTSGTGLVARWGMNEGAGTTIASSVGAFPGTLTNGPTWVPGSPFNAPLPTAPAAPTLLAAVATAGLQVDLSWTDNSTNEASFKVERSADGETGWAEIGTTAANVITYSNTGLNAGTQYCYRVRASNSIGDSEYSNVSCAITPGEPNNGLNFGSSNAYATFGNPPSLGLNQFTIETWFKRTGTGVTVTTGSSGIPNAIPLVTKGTSDVDNHDSRDFNYFLGINNDNGVLIADFEEGAGGTSPSLNHPVSGVTPIVMNTWYHAAATYDGTNWLLYLNGNLEATLGVGQPPRSDNTSPVALASSIKNDGTTLTAQGFFSGVMDETRIWDHARTQTQIQGTLNSAVTSPQSGLVARWGLNETTGADISSGAGTSVPGTITGSGSSWGPGSPSIVNHAPLFVSSTPANGAINITTPPTLTANFSDADLDALTVDFYGRIKNAPAGADFTIIAIPDPQYYAASYPSIYNAQMNWIVNNKTSSNIIYALSLGDNVDTSSSTTQWTNATTAYDILTAGGVQYGIEAGNHDGAPAATGNFTTYFGTRKTSQPTYGGRYGTSDYDN
ncbi:MAG: hypothetical protein HY864_18910 [Chloroflexi bacterium]|nr:hypothetical protein [Chloroflexota bacterium]